MKRDTPVQSLVFKIQISDQEDGGNKGSGYITESSWNTAAISRGQVPISPLNFQDGSSKDVIHCLQDKTQAEDSFKGKEQTPKLHS